MQINKLPFTKYMNPLQLPFTINKKETNVIIHFVKLTEIKSTREDQIVKIIGNCLF